ncbi:MAG: rRNA pseudouridine synthase, partial [Bacteroidetes bacterium]|nr:rRNA pseudouridine synthase [Bacteroidota bacterium]
MKSKPVNTHSPRIRINRFLAMGGVASRRKAEELVRAGKVAVNGRRIADLGTTVDPWTDRVTVSGRPIHRQERNVYLVVNKPKDTITTVRDERDR